MFIDKDARLVAANQGHWAALSVIGVTRASSGRSRKRKELTVVAPALDQVFIPNRNRGEPGDEQRS